MLNLNIVHPSHVSFRVLKRRRREKKHFSCGVFLLFHRVAKTVKATFLSHQLVMECYIGNTWYHLMRQKKNVPPFTTLLSSEFLFFELKTL